MSKRISRARSLFAAQVSARMREARKSFESARNWVLKGPFKLWLGVGTDPARLSYMHLSEELEAERVELLFFSVAFLDAGLGQAQLDEMAADFTRDFMGRFDDASNLVEPAGYRHFHRVLLAARQAGERRHPSSAVLQGHIERAV